MRNNTYNWLTLDNGVSKLIKGNKGGRGRGENSPQPVARIEPLNPVQPETSSPSPPQNGGEGWGEGERKHKSVHWQAHAFFAKNELEPHVGCYEKAIL
jgi:hypothetical protein